MAVAAGVFRVTHQEHPLHRPCGPADVLTSPDFEWSKPENLGPGVNSADDEYDPALTADGLRLSLRRTVAGCGRGTRPGGSRPPTRSAT